MAASDGLNTDQFPNIMARMPSLGVKSALSYAAQKVAYNVGGLFTMSGSAGSDPGIDRIQHEYYSGRAYKGGSRLTTDVQTALNKNEPYHLRAWAGDRARERMADADAGREHDNYRMDPPRA